MFPQKGSVNFTDHSSNHQDSCRRADPCKHVMSGKELSTDGSLSESGQTESGYLSSTNISSSGILLSDEYTPSSPKEDTQSRSYMRLDSDHGIGLSEHFSDLCNVEHHDLKSSACDSSSSSAKDFKVPSLQHCGKGATGETIEEHGPWELYFQQDEEGDTQLHIAIIQELTDVVYSLVRMIPNPSYLDIFNDLRQTGLHLAVLTAQPQIVRTLICAGVQTDIVDRNGNTPLHLATAAGDCECLRALTDPITVAETIALGLKYSPPQRPSRLPEIDMYNYEGLSCVHIAVMSGNIDILRHLYWLQADINGREWKSGRTALHLAVEMGDMKLAEILVKSMGAQADIMTYAGQTAYRLAKMNPEVISILNRIGIPYESDYSSSEEEEEEDYDSDSQFKIMESNSFRSHHTTNGMVDATA